jgi:RHS repeat-associated protein
MICCWPPLLIVVGNVTHVSLHLESTGGDECGPAPSGTTISSHHQSYSYDSLDRLTTGRDRTYSYGDPNHVHAVTAISGMANQYAAYDAMGNMTCRKTAAGTGHTCAGSNPSGATMTYDSKGQLASWTAPSGKTASDTFLYDAQGNRVLQSASSTVNGVTTVTDTLTFDGYSETTLTGGTTTTLTYYSLGGQRLAMQKNSNPVIYLLSDLLGSTDVAIKSNGTISAVQLYWPYGAGEYSWGTMPTSYNFTGQRLDSVTGLLYFNARYYDPVSGRFVRADTVQSNASGMDPYAYVGDSPIGKTDPTGQYISGGNGDTYYPDAPYYRGRNGTAYDIHTGLRYNGSGFSNGWLFGQGINAHPTRSSKVPLAGAMLPAALIKLAQKLIQNNERLSTDFGSSGWTVSSVKRGTDIVNDDGVYTQRWYFTMDDGEGSKVVLSLNFNPTPGARDPWDMPHIHFSNDQPDPDKWGSQGYARSADWFDPGASENPGEEDQMSSFAKAMFQFEEEQSAIEDAIIIEDTTD